MFIKKKRAELEKLIEKEGDRIDQDRIKYRGKDGNKHSFMLYSQAKSQETKIPVKAKKKPVKKPTKKKTTKKK